MRKPSRSRSPRRKVVLVAGEDGGPVQSRRFIASGHRRGKPHMLTSPNRDITASVVVLLILLAVLSLLTHCGGFDCPFGTVRVPDPVAGFRCEPAPRGEAACDGRREVCE